MMRRNKLSFISPLITATRLQLTGDLMFLKIGCVRHASLERSVMKKNVASRAPSLMDALPVVTLCKNILLGKVIYATCLQFSKEMVFFQIVASEHGIRLLIYNLFTKSNKNIQKSHMEATIRSEENFQCYLKGELCVDKEFIYYYYYFFG